MTQLFFVVVVVDRSEESFVQAIRTLQKFEKMSGLKMISDKTGIVLIGSEKHSQVSFLKDMNFAGTRNFWGARGNFFNGYQAG